MKDASRQVPLGRESIGFVDGVLIESFLDLHRDTMEEVHPTPDTPDTLHPAPYTLHPTLYQNTVNVKQPPYQIVVSVKK